MTEQAQALLDTTGPIEDADDRWWTEESGFFGTFYLQGDDSLEGHLAESPLSQEARTQREVDGVRRLARLRPSDRILDLPCGGGRHSLGLAALGHDVVGIDLNRTHLQRARQQALSRGLPAVFEEGNMLELGRAGEFDVVINMFYSFGFFATEDENRQVLEGFRKALKPGGRFLMHTDVNLQRVRSGAYRLHEKRNLKNGGHLLIDERFDEATRRIEGSWTIEHEGRTTRRTYSVRVYEVDEFVALCKSCGFRECAAFGDWDGGPCTAASEEIIFVAE